MTRFVSRNASFAAIAAAVLLAGCGQKPAPAGVGALPAAPTAAAEIDSIAMLLNAGDTKEAQRRLRAVLKTNPMDPRAQLLRDSIERDPQELLGPASYPYVVKPGETMSAIADRLLGNRLKAYQLARYNGIERPDMLAPGTTLRIPGTAPRAPVPPREAARPAPRPRPAAEKPAPARTAAPAPAAPTPTRPAANPAAAQQARAAGLAALNAGKVASAVAQLRRAAALDPGNAVIARDLARAQRIAATVRARQ